MHSTSPAKQSGLLWLLFCTWKCCEGNREQDALFMWKLPSSEMKAISRKESNHSALGQTWSCCAQGLITNGHSHTTQTHWEGFFFSTAVFLCKAGWKLFDRILLSVNIIVSKRFTSVYVNYRGEKIIAEIFLKCFGVYFSIVISVFIFSHSILERVGRESESKTQHLTSDWVPTFHYIGHFHFIFFWFYYILKF